MKTLVTGATGFIGSTVVRELLKDGVDVRVTVREDSDTRNIDGLDVERVYGDTRDRESMRTALKGCDALYHVAAYFAHWSLNKDLFYEVNVEGTKNILEEALTQGIEKVVYTSTANTVGAHGAGNLVNEDGEFNQWKTGDHYLITFGREVLMLNLKWRTPMCADRQINLENLTDGDQFYEIRKLTGEYFPFEIEKWDKALSMIRKLKQMFPTTISLWYLWKENGEILEEEIY